MSEEAEPKNPGVFILDCESSLFKSLVNRFLKFGMTALYSKHTAPITKAAVLQEEGVELKGVILSGSGIKLHSDEAPQVKPFLLELGLPVLAVCYGAEYLAEAFGGTVVQNASGETEEGFVPLTILEDSPLFKGLPKGGSFQVYMKHKYEVGATPEGFKVTARTPSCAVAAFEKPPFYCVQFHPESMYSLFGSIIINNFLQEICGVKTGYF